MTLCYIIKHGDTGLFCYIIWEIYIIIQVIAILKPKYIRLILTNIVDFILQEVYLINILINFCRLPYTFYKIDLLLEY